TLIQKSSNIGVAKMALELEPETIWDTYVRLGFGSPPGTGFPGEASGLMPPRPPQRPAERAALAYGYGLSVTPLQLASAYATIAADGVRRPVSFLALPEPPTGEEVISPEVARQVRAMMAMVVAEGGTAPQARVAGYRVAGKTGTSRKAIAGGYDDKAHLAYFARSEERRVGKECRYRGAGHHRKQNAGRVTRGGRRRRASLMAE